MGEFVKKAEDRKVGRRAIEAACQVVEEAEFTLLGDEVVDLSVDGMMVRSDALPPVGTAVFVSFRAPGTDHWIDTEATVARLVRGRRRSDRDRGLGLRFGQLSEQDREVLRRSLVGRPPPVPARHLRRDYAATIRVLAQSS